MDYTKRPNLQIGDIVLPRGQWNMGRVINTYPNRHNAVRLLKLPVLS